MAMSGAITLVEVRVRTTCSVDQPALPVGPLRRTMLMFEASWVRVAKVAAHWLAGAGEPRLLQSIRGAKAAAWPEKASRFGSCIPSLIESDDQWTLRLKEAGPYRSRSARPSPWSGKGDAEQLAAPHISS